MSSNRYHPRDEDDDNNNVDDRHSDTVHLLQREIQSLQQSLQHVIQLQRHQMMTTPHGPADIAAPLGGGRSSDNLLGSIGTRAVMMQQGKLFIYVSFIIGY